MCLVFGLSAAGRNGAGAQPELYLGGQPGAPVKIEVFSDYQCPVCRTFYLETLKPLLADYTKENKIAKICVVYRDYPLDMHPFARKAARFALAANRLSRERWLRVTDALYTEQAHRCVARQTTAPKIAFNTSIIVIAVAAEQGGRSLCLSELRYDGLSGGPVWFCRM